MDTILNLLEFEGCDLFVGDVFCLKDSVNVMMMCKHLRDVS